MQTIAREELLRRIGEPFGPSRWFTIDQDRIDAFAQTTEDRQFIHVDPERARAETPFGGTIAHGFLTLSLLSAMALDVVPRLEGLTRSINYGFERLRFIAPVRAGQRVRARFTLAGMQERSPGKITMSWNVEVEIEGHDKPALVAQWLGRSYLDA